jgi:hypothetical protein
MIRATRVARRGIRGDPPVRDLQDLNLHIVPEYRPVGEEHFFRIDKHRGLTLQDFFFCELTLQDFLWLWDEKRSFHMGLSQVEYTMHPPLCGDDPDPWFPPT